MNRLPVVGYRLWRADSEDLSLMSLSADEPWPIGTDLRSNKPPSTGRSGLGGYGFHALYRFHHGDPNQVRYHDSYGLWYSIERIHRRLHGEPNVHWVVGAIVAWGEIALHSYGFRSEFCRLVALHYQPTHRDIAMALDHTDMNPELPPTRLQMIADRYRVPVANTPASLDSYATEWGRKVSAEMLAA